MLLGQIELTHFRIRFSDILMGFGQIQFQSDGALIGAYRLIELPLLAVTETQVAVGFGIIAVRLYRFFILCGRFVLLCLFLIGFALLEIGVGLLAFAVG